MTYIICAVLLINGALVISSYSFQSEGNYLTCGGHETFRSY
ncbi:MAG: hypothetical protein ACTS6H_00895 [Candidatus Hodgkinia cicadicola]